MTQLAANPLLLVRHLRTYFDTDAGLVKAVDDVSFRMEAGKTFALVGESGCGKSVTAFSILRLIPVPPGLITSRKHLARKSGKLATLRFASPSEVLLEGRDLLSLSEGQMRRVRGAKISMIFQEPMTSLNPVFTCGDQIAEAVRLHRSLRRGEARDLAVDLLARVGIPEPARRFGEYPCQLSGGMRQRVMIAMALACNPKLLIADEPTTALDVTTQAQILDLLKEVQAAAGLAILLITHDLAVVAETAHTAAVMYASKIAEYADVGPLFALPLHPYTQALFRSLPRLGEKKRRLDTIGGAVPDPLRFPAGCKFHPRCPLCQDICRAREPALREVEPRHWAACWACPGYDQAKETDPGA